MAIPLYATRSEPLYSKKLEGSVVKPGFGTYDRHPADQSRVIKPSTVNQCDLPLSFLG